MTPAQARLQSYTDQNAASARALFDLNGRAWSLQLSDAIDYLRRDEHPLPVIGLLARIGMDYVLANRVLDADILNVKKDAE